jgi:hypothetical protein
MDYGVICTCIAPPAFPLFNVVTEKTILRLWMLLWGKAYGKRRFFLKTQLHVLHAKLYARGLPTNFFARIVDVTLALNGGHGGIMT